MLQIHCNNEKVHRVFADKQPSKGKEIYFMDATTYEEKEERAQRMAKAKATSEERQIQSGG